MEHRNITGLDALHPFSIRQAVDPGAIGADKGWWDTSVNPPRFRVRNALNTGWEDPQPVVPLPAEGRVTPDLQTLLAKNTRYNPRDYSLLDIGNDANDAGAAGIAAEGGSLAGAGIHWERPGTYRHTVARNYTRVHRMVPGAILKPVAVNINFAAPIEAGEYQIIDISLGTVSFNGSPQKEFLAAWVGVGPGNPDNGALLNKLEAMLPPSATIKLPSGVLDFLTTWMPGYTAATLGKQTMNYIGATNPLVDRQGATRLAWNGAIKPVTAADGHMSNGSFHLTSASNLFTAEMAARKAHVWVYKCGSTQFGRHKTVLRTFITAFNNAGDVTLNNANLTGVDQNACIFVVDGPEMCFLRSTNQCKLKWLSFEPAYHWDGAVGNYTNRCVRVDLSGEGNTGSSNMVEECQAYVPIRLPLPAFPHFVGFSTGDWSNGNQEFNVFRRCTTTGPGDTRKNEGARATITDIGAGKKRVALTVSIASGVTAAVGTRVRIGDAMGVDAHGIGIPIDTTLANLVNDHTIDIADPAVVAVVGANVTLGQSCGIGFLQGQSADLHREIYDECTTNNCEVGFYLLNGSAHLRDCTVNRCECDIEVTSGTLPFLITGIRGENSGQHLYYAAGSPLYHAYGSASGQNTDPNQAFIELHGGERVDFATLFDSLPPGSKLFNPFDFSGICDAARIQLANILPAQTGFTDFTSPVEEPASLLSTYARRNRRTYLHYNTGINSQPESLLVEHDNDGSSPTRNTAIRAIANPHATDANKEYTGVTASAGTKFPAYINTHILRCFLADQFTAVPGGGGPKAAEMIGYEVGSPGITAPGGTNLATGIKVQPQSGAGVDNSHGIFQLGTNDLNKFLGRTVRATPSTAPADSDIDPGCSSDWTDEAGNTRKSRVRYSGGTYKTETGPALV